MKKNMLRVAILALVTLLSRPSHGQGTFVYDQQSSIEGVDGEFGVNVQTMQPLGQSFTPNLPSVGFIRLRFGNAGTGGAIYVNLRENSITGNVLAASTAITLPDRFDGYTDFLFPTTPSVTPDVLYFFQPVVESGSGWFLNYHNGFNYARGNAVFQGTTQPTYDLWFREGIVVPEPGTWALLVVGCGLLAWRKCLFR